MNDKELLELAAKAARVPAYWGTDGTLQARPIFVVSAGGRHGTMPFEEEWNPLKNDCDALRLAATSVISVSQYGEEVVADCVGAHVVERIKTDRLSAMRRAIVRAAAAIGAQMP